MQDWTLAAIELVALGNTLYVGTTFANPAELWRVDGNQVTSLFQWPHPAGFWRPGPQLTAVGSEVMFVAFHPATGLELHKTNGTAQGTGLVADIRVGAEWSIPAWLTSAGGTLFFSADDGINGVELWRSDGTAAGTVRVTDLAPGLLSSYPTELFPAGSGARVLFSATTLTDGREVFVADGTTAGARMLTDIGPAQASGSPRAFTRVGTKVVFVANDGNTGEEPWVLPLASTGGNLLESFGQGCAGTGGLVPATSGLGLPTLGNATFAARLRDARPNAATAFLVAVPAAQIALPGGCALLTPNPVLTVPLATDALGRSTMPLAVPANPRLLGLELRLQFAVVDPAGAFGGLLSLSDGLRLMCGG